MKDNVRVVEALKKAIEINPDVKIGQFMNYIMTVDDPAYMEDGDIAEHLEEYNKDAVDENLARWNNYQFDPGDTNVFEMIWSDTCDKYYVFSKENEQIAYERYRKRKEQMVSFELEERLDCSEFLKRFELMFDKPEAYKGITLINHCSEFRDPLRTDYRHMMAYVVGKKGDKYVAYHAYVVKNPCFGELFGDATVHLGAEGCIGKEGKYIRADAVFDEWFSMPIDWYENPRFVDYTRHIMYGAYVRPEKREIEIFSPDQSVEIFHEMMQKSNKIVSDWDGVLYDDGTFTGGDC